MRAKTLLTILFLLSLGVAAWLFLHALPQNATADVQPTPKEEVLVAAGPLAAGTLRGRRDERAEPAHAGHRPAARAGWPFGHARSDPRAGGEGRRRGRARQIVAAAAPCRRYRAGQRHSGQPRPPDLGRRRVPRLGDDQAGR